MTGFQLGDRVVCETAAQVCQQCVYCLTGNYNLCPHRLGYGALVDGAFTHYVAARPQILHHIPQNVPFAHAALTEPICVAYNALVEKTAIKPGDTVLIQGPGPIGIMAAAICRYVGSRHVVITDINPYRLELAKKIKGIRTVDVSKENLSDIMKELDIEEGFDIGLEMSGSVDAFRDMITTLNHGAKIAMLGIPPSEMAIDWTQVIFKGLTIKGIYGREMYETWYKMTVMLQSGLDIKPVITHRFPYSEFEKGFEVMQSGASGKVVLSWV